MTASSGAEVTLVVTPREKFSVCRQGLESIIEHTAQPYRLVYVDGGSPGPVRRYLADRCARQGFELIRTERYLTPNEGRLLGLERVRTPYTVFIDNDVIVSPGWLRPLLDCAQTTGAAVVGPLICQGHPVHEIVHCAGGTCGVKEIVHEGEVERHVFERIAKQGRKVADVRPSIGRSVTGLAEFHCLLTRTEVARQPGIIDPAILSTREHIDYCMNVQAAGGAVWLEPDSIVTYLHDVPLQRTDLPYFMLRWGDAWERRSLTHLIGKWGLTTKGTAGYRLAKVGWRRRSYLVTPMFEKLTARLPQGVGRGRTRDAFFRAEGWLNGAISRMHDLRTSLKPRPGR